MWDENLILQTMGIFLVFVVKEQTQYYSRLSPTYCQFFLVKKKKLVKDNL